MRYHKLNTTQKFFEKFGKVDWRTKNGEYHTKTHKNLNIFECKFMRALIYIYTYII